MAQQMVPPWEPPETGVVPGSSSRGGEVVVKVFAARMPLSLINAWGVYRLHWRTRFRSASWRSGRKYKGQLQAHLQISGNCNLVMHRRRQ
eukprot:1144103-Pelagomonas_calceolata.AAC.9